MTQAFRGASGIGNRPPSLLPRRAWMARSLMAFMTMTVVIVAGLGRPALAEERHCVPAPKAILVGCVFNHQNLTGAHLADSDLAGDSFKGANLTGAHLTSAQLPGANLAGANFTHATLAHAHLERSDIAGAILVGDLYRVFSGGLIGRPARLPPKWKLVDGYLIGPSAKLTGAKLARADLVGAHLGDSDLFGAELRGANLSHATLISGHLGRADLQGANLAGVLARAEEFRHANLKNANLTGAVIQGSNLHSAHLQGARLGGVLWRNDICPDGTQSLLDGNTCIRHLVLKDSSQKPT